MRTYFVYLCRVVRKGQYQDRIGVTTDYKQDLQHRGRANVPAIWKVVGKGSKEEAKASVLRWVASIPELPNGVTRIR